MNAIVMPAVSSDTTPIAPTDVAPAAIPDATPDATPDTAPDAAPAAESATTTFNVIAKHDVMGTAMAAGHFKTLTDAIKSADLVGAFKGKGPFTVFAPTDGAFKKLPAGVLDDILNDKVKLVSLIKAHVLPSKLLSKDIATRQSKTLEGNTLNIVNADGKITIDDAKVTAMDIQASNGVIHAIDNVILPKS